MLRLIAKVLCHEEVCGGGGFKPFLCKISLLQFIYNLNPSSFIKFKHMSSICNFIQSLCCSALGILCCSFSAQLQIFFPHRPFALNCCVIPKYPKIDIDLVHICLQASVFFCFFFALERVIFALIIVIYHKLFNCAMTKTRKVSHPSPQKMCVFFCELIYHKIIVLNHKIIVLNFLSKFALNFLQNLMTHYQMMIRVCLEVLILL